VRTTEEQREYYRQNGHVTIEGFLTPKHLAAWRAWFDDAVGQRTEGSNFTEKVQLDSIEGAYYNTILNQKTNLRFRHGGIMTLFNDVKAVLGRVAAELEGWSGTRLYDEQALVKEPYGGATNLHYDGHFWGFTSPSSITAWVPLDDATQSNGCMYMLEGSHRITRARFDALGGKFPPEGEVQWWNMRDIFREGNFPEVAPLTGTPVEVKAGGISFHSGFIIHGSGPNWTNKQRRAMTFAMMPTGSRFNGNKDLEKTLSPDQAARYKPGDELNDESIHTLMYGK